jgi:murein DD-endopeptidase MepM/ murein hydrolase activator NlpD
VSYDPFLNDLLRNQRGFRRKRGQNARRITAVAFLLTAGLVYWFISQPSDEAREQLHVQNVERGIDAAKAGVLASVDASLLPVEVIAKEESQKEGAEAAKEEIKVWTEGQAIDFDDKLEKNESVFAALQKRGLGNRNIHLVVSATGEKFNFRHSRPGDSWSASVDGKGNITRFRYQTSPEDIWETRLQPDGTYICEKVQVPLEIKQTVVAGVVTTSLWQSMENAGLSAPIVGKFIDVFSHEVDFGAETRPGDRFSLVFEKIYLDGEELRDGRVLAARYITPSKQVSAYWYETTDDDQGYFNDKGKSLQRQFLKSPLSNVRITSVYGRRFHPVLKRWKMHNGVDYGAPTGTPVMAVADGTVAFAGWKGANGKLVSIKHKKGYTTHYAHLSHIPKSIKRGVPVTKKTIIGRVGSTGRSTGPHLHFGMSTGGKFIDPMKVDFVRGPSLSGQELVRLDEMAIKPMGELMEAALSKGEQHTTPSVVASEDTFGGDDLDDQDDTAYP